MTENQTNPDPRAEYIAGMRMLADLLEANPHLALPFEGNTSEGMVFVTRGEGQRERLAQWAKALPGEKTKTGDGTDGEYFALHARLRGYRLKVIANRDEVCEKVVLGHDVITETVPDPDYMAAAPMVERETVKEIVEWRCNSILAGASS